MFNNLFSFDGYVVQIIDAIRPVLDVLVLSFIFYFIYRLFSSVNLAFYLISLLL